jgi:plastocyanin
MVERKLIMKKIVFCLIGLLLIAPGVFAGSITGKVSAVPLKDLKDTVVYLKNATNMSKPKTITMDQKKLEFLPHILPIVVGDSVEFNSQDPVIHDVVVTSIKTQAPLFSLTMQPGAPSVIKPFTTVDAYRLSCHFHLEMLAYIFVGSNPYMAVVDKTGHYTISDVPDGTYQIAVWNPNLKAEDQSAAVPVDKPVTVNFSLKK